MPRVRTHKVRRGGKTFTRRQHERSGGASSRGIKLRPRRAWNHAKRAHLSARQRKHAAAALFATAAVTEIAAFTAFRAVGGVLAVVGVGIGLLGAGLYMSTKP